MPAPTARPAAAETAASLIVRAFIRTEPCRQLAPALASSSFPIASSIVKVLGF